MVYMAAFLAAKDADVIFYNGKVVTLSGGDPIAEAVAVKGTRITAVGRSRVLLEQEKGQQTRVVDLKGRTVLPGLIDAHVHALGAGLSELRQPLPKLDSISALQ